MHRCMLGLVLCLVTAALPAQLERGCAVYSKLWNPAFPGSPGGLVTFHPVHGMFTSITGLPPELTVQSPSVPYPTPPTQAAGAESVLVRDGDGSLLVGPTVRNGNPLQIFHLTLAGTLATVLAVYPIGTPAAGALVDQMAWLPNGDVLFTHRGAMPPFPPQGLASLDLATGVVTGVPFAPLPANSTINAVAVDPTGTVAFVGMVSTGPNFVSQIYTVPLPIGGVPMPVLTSAVTGAISQLAFDCAGQMYCTLQGPGLLAVVGGTAVPVTPPAVLAGLNAMAIDAVSGDTLLAKTPAGTVSDMFRWNAAAGLVQIPGMSATDSPTGLAIRASMVTYGTVGPSPTQTVRWDLCPNPGGAPVIPRTGVNTNFSVSMTVSPNTAPLGLLLFSLGPITPAPPCVAVGPFSVCNILIDPLLAGVPIVQLPTGVPTTYAFALPIPAGLSPMHLYAQMFHLDLTQLLLSGSEGLDFRIH